MPLPVRASTPPSNLWVLGPTRLHIPKRHVDQFSHFCTAHGRISIYFTMGCPFLTKVAPFHRENWTPSNTWFLWHNRVCNQNDISIGSAVLHCSRQSVLILYNRSPSKLSLLMGDGPHLIHGSLSPLESIIQTASRSVQSFFAGLTIL